MSKEVLVDKYGNEFVKIEVKYNNKAQSIVMNDWRIGGCKWNDVDNGKFLTLLVNKKDLINELGANKQIADLEAKLAESEKENKRISSNNLSHSIYIDKKIERLEQQLAEKEEQIKELTECNQYLQIYRNQDKISFAVDILEELADYSNYINSKLDFECGSYVSEKAIRDKIKYLKGNENE